MEIGKKEQIQFNQFDKINSYNYNLEKNITYVDNYRINDNSNWNIKLWNKTLIKYQEHFKNNNFQLQNTLLFNFIQNDLITIEREFGETIFNDFMKEEQTFIHTCNEILK